MSLNPVMPLSSILQVPVQAGPGEGLLALETVQRERAALRSKQPALVGLFDRLSERQQQAMVKTLQVYPGARVEDLVALTRTHSWTSAGQQSNPARRQAGLLRAVAMLSTVVAGDTRHLAEDKGRAAMKTGRTLDATMRDVAANTLHAVLAGTVEVILGSKSEVSKTCPPQARACVDKANPRTLKPPLYLQFSEVEGPGGWALDPFHFVPTMVHEVSHGLDFRVLGPVPFHSTLLGPGRGYFTLATEYKAYRAEVLASAVRPDDTSVGRWAFAAWLRSLRDRPEIYPSSAALLSSNKQVRALFDRALQAAERGLPMSVSAFVSALWALRQQDTGFLGFSSPDAIERKFFTQRHNERNRAVHLEK